MLRLQDLAAIWEEHRTATADRVREFDLQGRHFDFNSRSAIMGVVNLSADSWYRESVCLTAEAAIQRGMTLVAQGAQIVDIGAESTLANAARADSALQNSRLIPVVTELSKAGVLVSAETYEPVVAKACLEAGAAVINLTGTSKADEIYRMAADHGVAVILCYVQGEHVRAVGDFELNHDPIPQMEDYFSRELERASKCGLETVIIDPGLGFYYRNLQDSAVRVRHQMKTFLNTFRLRKLGFPVCHALPHAFEHFREEVRSAEPFFAVLAALGKTDLLRTHEVPRVRAVLDTLSAW